MELSALKHNKPMQMQYFARRIEMSELNLSMI